MLPNILTSTASPTINQYKTFSFSALFGILTSTLSLSHFLLLLPSLNLDAFDFVNQLVNSISNNRFGMKFGKRLKQQMQDTLPEWRDNFLSYKELKKLIRLMSSTENGSIEYGKAEAEFVYLLNNEIEKFNAFFMEKEEDFIIRNKELQQRIQRVTETWGQKGTHPSETEYKQGMANIRNDMVNFHGEMVLLINYSNINYTGLAKILKKNDKRTGGLLRLPFIQKVLQQPFFTTDLISKLVKECESTIEEAFPAAVEEERKSMGSCEMTLVGEGIFRNTVAALLTMREIRSGSSTYSNFSLPPLSLAESEPVQSIPLNSPIPIL